MKSEKSLNSVLGDSVLGEPKPEPKQTDLDSPITARESFRMQCDREHLQRLAARWTFILLLLLAFITGLVVNLFFPQESRGWENRSDSPKTSWQPRYDPHRGQLSLSCECQTLRSKEYQAYLKERQEKTYGTNSKARSKLIKNYPPFQTQTCSGSWYQQKKYQQEYEAAAEKKRQAEKTKQAEKETTQSADKPAAASSSRILPAPRLPQLGDQGKAESGKGQSDKP